MKTSIVKTHTESYTLLTMGGKNAVIYQPAETGSEKAAANSMDVLLGRGRISRNNPGNVLFQELIHANVVRYAKLSKMGKRGIVKEIMYTIHEVKGRFIRLDDQNEWTVISESEAQQKIAHAIQYRLRHHGSQYTQTVAASSAVATAAVNEVASATRSDLKEPFRKKRQSRFVSGSSQFLSYPTTTNHRFHSVTPNGKICYQEKQHPQSKTTTAVDGVASCAAVNEVARATWPELKLQYPKQQQNCFLSRSSRFLSYPTTTIQLYHAIPPNDNSCSLEETQRRESTTTAENDVHFVNGCNTATIAAASDYLIDSHSSLSQRSSRHHIHPSIQQRGRVLWDSITNHRPSVYMFNNERANQYDLNADNMALFVANGYSFDQNQVPTIPPVEKKFNPPSVQLLPATQLSPATSTGRIGVVDIGAGVERHDVVDIGVGLERTAYTTSTVPELSYRDVMSANNIPEQDMAALNADMLAFCRGITQPTDKNHNGGGVFTCIYGRGRDTSSSCCCDISALPPPKYWEPIVVPLAIDSAAAAAADDFDDDWEVDDTQQPVVEFTSSLPRTTSDLSSWDGTSCLL